MPERTNQHTDGEGLDTESPWTATGRTAEFAEPEKDAAALAGWMVGHVPGWNAMALRPRPASDFEEVLAP